MDPELSAQGTLALFAVAAVAILLLQAARWPDGRQAWLLSVLNRFYVYCFFHLRTNRACPFPDKGPAIIIANHSSPMDPMFVWLGRNRAIGFMMAREYYEIRFIHWIFKSMRSIPVERNGKDTAPTRAALRRLKEGRLVGLFPEGQINRAAELLPGNPGMAWLALHSQVPVYPVYVHNSPGGNNMVEPFYNFCRVRVTYGEEIDLSEYYGQKKTRELLQEVTDVLMARMAELGNVGWKTCVDNHSPDTEVTSKFAVRYGPPAGASYRSE